MLARIVEFRPASEAAAQFAKVVEETTLGIAQAQAGCVAAFIEAQEDCVLAVSIWKSTNAVERYGRECYPELVKMLRPFLTCDPKVSTFDTRELNITDLPVQMRTSVSDYLRGTQAA